MAKNCVVEGIGTTVFLTGSAAAILGQVCCLAAGTTSGIEMTIAGAAVAATVVGLSLLRLFTLHPTSDCR